MTIRRKVIPLWPKVSPEPQPRALPRLLGLNLTVARRRLGMQRRQQAAGRGAHLVDGAVEGFGIGLRRLVEARKLAHELQRRGLDLILGGRRLEIEQRLDVAAHLLSPWSGRPLIQILYPGSFWHRMGATFTPVAPAKPSEFRDVPRHL